MDISRAWCMPNANTFEMKPIRLFIEKYLPTDPTAISIDPFARGSKLCKLTNDLDNSFDTSFNMDALEFLKSFPANYADLILFDPPYSPRQVSECYKKLGRSVNMQTTQSSFWGNIKREIARVVKSGGTVISFGWNSGGIGKTNGFTIIEILLVAHGGNHNDTICTVERKI